MESDELEDIVVIMYQDGGMEVRYKGEEVRAIVRDYNVEFPIDAATVQKDEDGDYYKEIIV